MVKAAEPTAPGSGDVAAVHGGQQHPDSHAQPAGAAGKQLARQHRQQAACPQTQAASSLPTDAGSKQQAAVSKQPPGAAGQPVERLWLPAPGTRVELAEPWPAEAQLGPAAGPPPIVVTITPPMVGSSAPGAVAPTLEHIYPRALVIPAAVTRAQFEDYQATRINVDNTWAHRQRTPSGGRSGQRGETLHRTSLASSHMLQTKLRAMKPKMLAGQVNHVNLPDTALPLIETAETVDVTPTHRHTVFVACFLSRLLLLGASAAADSPVIRRDLPCPQFTGLTSAAVVSICRTRTRTFQYSESTQRRSSQPTCMALRIRSTNATAHRRTQRSQTTLGFARSGTLGSDLASAPTQSCRRKSWLAWPFAAHHKLARDETLNSLFLKSSNSIEHRKSFENTQVPACVLSRECCAGCCASCQASFRRG